MNLLTVKNLKKHFPIRSGVLRKQTGSVKAVDGISFHVERGEVLGIVGESGSGKSTVGRAAIRLIEPTEGQIDFDGDDLRTFSPAQLRKWRPKAQMVFQDPYSSLNPRKTIGESIAEPLRFHGRDPNRLATVLDLVGLSPTIVDRYPHQFSGGQQQRVCIARALALNPELIICDEAVSALDVSVQAQILNLLADLKQELGLSLIFISHDLSVVRYLCDRIIVLHHGRIVEEGPTEAIFTNPQDPYTQTLLAAIPKERPSP